VGSAGDQISVTLAQTTGFNEFQPATTSIYTPTGEKLVTFSANSERTLTLEEAGTYVMRIFANDNVGTGDYAIGLECLVPPSMDVVSISCGGSVQTTIGTAAETDLYSFTGSAGNQVSVTLTQTSGFDLFHPVVASIYTPTGAELVTFSADNQKALTLDETGTHVMRIYASGYTGKGGYVLSLTCP